MLFQAESKNPQPPPEHSDIQQSIYAKTRICGKNSYSERTSAIGYGFWLRVKKKNWRKKKILCEDDLFC